MTEEQYVLILYYSGTGQVAQMARQMAKAVEQTGIEAKVRTVPKVSLNTEQSESKIPVKGDVYATIDDLAHCSGLLLGSPGYFGNMSSHLKFFFGWCQLGLDVRSAH